MKRLLAVSILLFSFAFPGSAADQQLLGLMAPDAKVLAGANFTQVLNSPFGQYLLSQIPTADANYQLFLQTTGFDPTRDIAQLVASSSGVPGQQTGLVAVRGTFDVARIVAFAKMAGAKVDESAGVPLIASPDGKGSLAFLDNTLALVGDVASVTAAIPRKSSPSLLDPALVTKAGQLSGAQDAWVVTNASVPAVPAGPNGVNLSVLQNVQQASAGVKFGTSVVLSAEAVADTAPNANALADIVRMLVAVVQNTQANAANAQAAQLAALLKSLTISTQGPALQLSLSIPEELLEQITPANKPHKERRAALQERK